MSSQLDTLRRHAPHHIVFLLKPVELVLQPPFVSFLHHKNTSSSSIGSKSWVTLMPQHTAPCSWSVNTTCCFSHVQEEVGILAQSCTYATSKAGQGTHKLCHTIRLPGQILMLFLHLLAQLFDGRRAYIDVRKL